MKTIFLQVSVPLDSIGLDMAQTTEPVEKHFQFLNGKWWFGGQIIMLTLGVLSLHCILFLGTFSSD